MATWTAATAIPSGGLITSAWMNNVTSMVNFLGGASLTTSKDMAMLTSGTATQTLVASTWTAVSFPVANEIYDTADGHGTANPTRYTVKASGKYLVSGYVGQAAGGTTGEAVSLGFRVNGSGTTRPGNGREYAFVNINNARDITYTTPTVGLSLSVGDYVELMISHASAVTIGFNDGNKLQNGMQIQWIGA